MLGVEPRFDPPAPRAQHQPTASQWQMLRGGRPVRHRAASDPVLIRRTSAASAVTFRHRSTRFRTSTTASTSRKQNVTSQHSASDDFSPMFSNAASEHASSTHNVTDAASAQKRSEPNGDHHLTFVDPLDSPPTRH